MFNLFVKLNKNKYTRCKLYALFYHNNMPYNLKTQNLKIKLLIFLFNVKYMKKLTMYIRSQNIFYLHKTSVRNNKLVI